MTEAVTEPFTHYRHRHDYRPEMGARMRRNQGSLEAS